MLSTIYNAVNIILLKALVTSDCSRMENFVNYLYTTGLPANLE